VSFVQIKTYQHQGLEKKEIFVQAIKTRGLAHLSLTGNIAHTLRDSRDKLKAVVTKASSWGPVDKVLVNVLPVDLPKFSSHLELPIALAIRILLSEEDMTIAAYEKIKNVSFIGSVSLSGEVEGEAIDFSWITSETVNL
jgi:magnesium chelatase family protein